jgi:RNA recognition motif-containing protein
MVLNLHDDVEAGDLQEIFSEVGKVLGSKVDRHPDGSSKGTAEVLMATRQQAEKAKEEFDAAEVNGRIIGVRMLGAAGTGGRVQVQKHNGGSQARPAHGRGGGFNDDRTPQARAQYGGYQGPQGPY